MRKQWAEWEKITAMDMHNQGKSIPEIAALLGRTYYSVDGYVHRRHDKQAHSCPSGRRDNVSNVSVPEYLVAERDRRSQERSEMQEAALRMGDPPFSQSALARRA